MNACEKIQIARMNLRAGRGRSIESLTESALRALRNERKKWNFMFVVEDIDGSMPYGFFGTLREARFWQLRTMRLKGLECVVRDMKTNIQIF